MSAVARIESLSHEGRGIARLGGKAVFIDGALPGEEVGFRYLKKRARFDEGVVTEVRKPSPDRVDPPCEYAGRCGGCSLQHLDTAAQLRHKQAILLEQLQHGARVEPRAVLPPVTGPTLGYRRKARLGVKYVKERGRAVVGFREKHSRLIADLDRCIVLHEAVGPKLGALAALVGSLRLRASIPQIEVAISEGGTVLVFRHLRDMGEDDRELLEAFEHEHGLRIYLQPGGEDSVHPLTPGTEADLRYTLVFPSPAHGEGQGGGTLSPGVRLGNDIRFQFDPTHFTQVNFEINGALVRQVIELLAPSPGDSVLDLFCGIGNFSLGLARRAGRVLGVEGDAGLVERAAANAMANSVENVVFTRANLAAADSTEDFMTRDWDRVLLDPPRAGAKEVLAQLHLDATRVLVYVSCNPATLARDTALLVHEKGFTLDRVGIVDMFPHTSHVESVAVFTRT